LNGENAPPPVFSEGELLIREPLKLKDGIRNQTAQNQSKHAPVR
jgi:hypothetical protein